MRRVAIVVASISTAAVICVAAVSGVRYWDRNRRAGADRLLAEARSDLKAGRKDEAMTNFARYLGKRPDDVESRREYAELVLERTQAGRLPGKANAEAFKLLESVVRQIPDDHWLRYRLAESEVRIQQYTSAIEHLEVLRDACGPDGRLVEGGEGRRPIGRLEIISLLADALAKTGRPHESVRVLSELVGFDPLARRFSDQDEASRSLPPGTSATTSAFLQLANLLEREIHDDEAAGLVIAQNTVANSGDASAWVQFAAWKFFHDKDTPAAIEAIGRATKLAPDDPMVMNANFQLAVSRKAYDEAAGIVDRAIALHPGYDWPYLAKAKLLLRAPDRQGTVDVVADGIARVGAKEPLLQMLVDLPGEPAWSSAIAGSLPGIRQALKGSSPYVAVLDARLLMARGDWLAAERLLSRTRPEAAAAAALMRAIDLAIGRCYEGLGEPDLQLAAFQRVLTSHPEDIPARVGAALALLGCGRQDAALAALQAVASRMPRGELAARPEVWQPLIRLRCRAEIEKGSAGGDWSGIESFARSLEQQPEFPAQQVAILEAEILEGKGDHDGAIERLERAVEAAAENSAVQGALFSIVSRTRGGAAARARFDAVPEVVRSDTGFLVAAARALADTDGDDAAAVRAEIERRASAGQEGEASIPVLLELAASGLECGRMVDAVRCCDLVLARTPDAIRAWMIALAAADGLGDAGKADAAAAEIARIMSGEDTRSRYARATAKVIAVRGREAGKGRKLPSTDRDELEAARRELMIVEAARPEWVDVQRQFAECDLLEDDIPAAISRLRNVLQLQPGNVVVASRLLMLLNDASQFVEAERILDGIDAASRHSPGRVAVELKLRCGKSPDAVVIAERLAQTDGSTAADLVWLGDVLERNGRSDSAGEAFARAIRLEPALPDAWLGLIGQQAHSGREQDAEESLRRGLEAVDAARRELLLAEGNNLLGRRAEAERHYGNALAQDGMDLLTNRLAAAFFEASGRQDKAEEILTRIIDSSATGSDARATKAWARRRLAALVGRGETAADFDRALGLLKRNSTRAGHLEPEDAAVAAELLAARADPASWRQALDALGKLAAQQPLSIEQQVLSARLRDRLGDWRNSRRDLETLSKAPTNSLEAATLLTERLVARGELTEAASRLADLQASRPDAVETLALQARLALAGGDKSAAIDAARRIMPSDEGRAPDVDEALFAARLMEDLGFRKAADAAYAMAAAAASDGVLARVAYLGRTDRPRDALDSLLADLEHLPLDRAIREASEIILDQRPPLAADVVDRVRKLADAARAEVPDSVGAAALEADLRAIGDPADAVEAYRSLLGRKDLRGALRAHVSAMLARSLMSGGDAQRALPAIDAAIVLVGPRPDLLDVRGLINLDLGKTSAALDDFNEASLVPSPTRLLHLALCLSELGNRQAAAQVLAMATQMGLAPDSLSPADQRRLALVMRRTRR